MMDTVVEVIGVVEVLEEVLFKFFVTLIHLVVLLLLQEVKEEEQLVVMVQMEEQERKILTQVLPVKNIIIKLWI
jgi:hypothetical protein